MSVFQNRTFLARQNIRNVNKTARNREWYHSHVMRWLFGKLDFSLYG